MISDIDLQCGNLQTYKLNVFVPNGSRSENKFNIFKYDAQLEMQMHVRTRWTKLHHDNAQLDASKQNKWDEIYTLNINKRK
jgi:hypothetical protein